MEKQIDIIIPAYNAHNTIEQTLRSIASQTISNLCRVTIVNDCSNENYSEIINKFLKLLDIREITLEKNVGCGLARQIGLDNAEYKYIMFVDADDMFFNSFSIASLYYNIETKLGKNGKEINAIYGKILETDINSLKIINEIDGDHGTWLFGSIYRKSFIDKYKIKFNNSSRGEDLAFNKIIKIISPFEQLATMSDVPVYFWTNANPNRINTEIFKELYAKIGYIENLIYVYNFLNENFNEYLQDKENKLDAIANFVGIYFQYQELLLEKHNILKIIPQQEYEKEIGYLVDLMRELYEKNYIFFEADITNKDLCDVYEQNISRMVGRGGRLNTRGLSFFEFMDNIKNNNLEKLKLRM